MWKFSLKDAACLPKLLLAAPNPVMEKVNLELFPHLSFPVIKNPKVDLILGVDFEYLQEMDNPIHGGIKDLPVKWPNLAKSW